MRSVLRRILVCEAQVPFVRGGAESLVRELVGQLRQRGYEADLVSVPFKWYPFDELFSQAAAWRLLDLSEANGKPVDLVITTKFPTYCVRHPRKVTWLVHQHRAAYELAGTSYSEFHHRELDVAVRERLMTIDTAMLRESSRVFTIARTVSARLARFNGVPSEPLYHPPRLADRIHGGPSGDYVLSIGRLESVKRVDLIIRAMTHAPRGVRLVIGGTGTQRATFERIAVESGVSDRVTFLGEIDDATLLDLYAGCLAVVYPPFDEDFGYVTLEAFLAKKPVITTVDAGEPTEFVRDGESGYIVEPDPAALGAAIGRLDADRRLAARLGETGYDAARRISWTDTIQKLVDGLDT